MDILDDDQYLISKKNNRIPSIGLGVFLYLTLIEYSYLLCSLAKDALIAMELDELLILFIIETISLFFVIILFLMAITKIKNDHAKRTVYYMKLLIGLLVISQGLQFFYGFYQYEIWTNEHYIKIATYYDTLQTSSFNGLVNPIFTYLRWMGIGFIIFKNKVD